MVGGRKRHEAEVVGRAGKAIFFFFEGNVAFFFFSGIGVVKLAGAAEVCLLRVTSLAVVELEVDCCCGGRSLAALVAVAAFAFAPPPPWSACITIDAKPASKPPTLLCSLGSQTRRLFF